MTNQRAVALALLAMPAFAHAEVIDGAALSLAWSLPFIGLLLCIALMPLAMPTFWHAHFGKIVAGWSLAFALPFAMTFGASTAASGVAHTLFAEYLPFVILLVALFTTAGGIYVRGNLHGSPAMNVGLMAAGAVLASVMGTTGASILMLRPLIRANDSRKNAAHVMVFFIFIVANASGALTPLGDPPLFLGFLQGVPFFWPMRHLAAPALFVVAALLAIFYAIDTWRYRTDGTTPGDPTPDTSTYGIDGAINLLPLAVIIGLVLLSGTWKPGVAWHLFGTELTLQQLVRDGGLVATTLFSLAITPKSVRDANEFSWAPMREVAQLFAGIFITMLPVLAMLKVGEAGAFSAIARAVTGADGRPEPWAYFWLSGALSSFLDNAPTYLVFFNLAGGDPGVLTSKLATTLAAISAGSVFMGANTYIGNAPNFMVKAIAESRGILMPSFFGYMVWSSAVLLPLFILVTFIWFR